MGCVLARAPAPCSAHKGPEATNVNHAMQMGGSARSCARGLKLCKAGVNGVPCQSGSYKPDINLSRLHGT